MHSLSIVARGCLRRTRLCTSCRPVMHALSIVARGLVAAALFGTIGGALAAQSQDPTQDPRFARGRALFDHAFHRVDGLGSPDMNADSCRACHRDPSMGGAGPLELNVSRFGSDFGGVFTNLPGGQGLSKLRPPFLGGREEYVFPANVFEQRQTPSIFGDHLIDSIPGVAITANEDPNDADADGVRGVARRLDIGGTIEIGRFGWKAQVPRLADFVRDAAFGELGITTSDNGRGFGAQTDSDPIADPELSDTQTSDIAFFLHALPPPARGGSTDPRVAIGEQLFTSVGCAKCHRPSLPGANGPVPLFSDLLLHNIMNSNFRGMSEPGAGVGLYRTPPLWGIRHTAPYLHDGRAEDLTQAILVHFGEAATANSAFRGLSADDRTALLLFLEDL